MVMKPQPSLWWDEKADMPRPYTLPSFFGLEKNGPKDQTAEDGFGRSAGGAPFNLAAPAFWGDRQAPAPRAVALGGRRLEGTASRGCASSDQRSGSGLRGVKQWLAPPGSPEDRQRERPTREENGPESSGVQESSESTHTHTHEGRMRRALTAAAAAAVTNEAPDLSSTALWTARGRVLLCLPLLYDSPVSTFVAHVDGMDRSSDQVISPVDSSH